MDKTYNLRNHQNRERYSRTARSGSCPALHSYNSSDWDVCLDRTSARVMGVAMGVAWVLGLIPGRSHERKSYKYADDQRTEIVACVGCRMRLLDQYKLPMLLEPLDRQALPRKSNFLQNLS
jgi:hypothetical protein